jgi:hypothetical protein
VDSPPLKLKCADRFPVDVPDNTTCELVFFDGQLASELSPYTFSLQQKSYCMRTGKNRLFFNTDNNC